MNLKGYLVVGVVMVLVGCSHQKQENLSNDNLIARLGGLSDPSTFDEYLFKNVPKRESSLLNEFSASWPNARSMQIGQLLGKYGTRPTGEYIEQGLASIETTRVYESLFLLRFKSPDQLNNNERKLVHGLIKSQSGEIKLEALKVLPSDWTGGSDAMIADCLKTGNIQEKKAVLLAMSMKGGTRFYKFAEVALQDKEPSVRISAIQALLKLDRPRALVRIKKHRDSSPQVRRIVSSAFTEYP